ncbi:MAG TPA: hypothetical protein VK968_06815 [Roseimicrobium sp.]|nr:hypothetical protein [Roseimicrobium sp.]
MPLIRLGTVFPPGSAAGTTVEVNVTGTDLDEISELRFSNPGLTAKQKPGAANTFLVTVATNVPAGSYEARIGGRFGLSNPKLFAVGTSPETNILQANHQPATATEIAADTVVNGRTEANNIDHFRFTAKKGQRFLIECSAREIDSRLEEMVSVIDIKGIEHARQHRGGILDFTAPADGAFLVLVHDRMFRGGEDYAYRLNVSTKPRVDFVLPAAGVPGTKTHFTLYGRNLPGGVPVKDQVIDGRPLEKLETDIDISGDPQTATRLNSVAVLPPAAAVMDGFDYRLPTSRGFANPVFIAFTKSPVITETEPNQKPAAPQTVTVPCEINGQFWPAGDTDVFQFTAKKGENYTIELFSQRLGLPTDPFAMVQRVSTNAQNVEQVSDLREMYDEDTNIGGREFNTTSRDPSWRLEVKEDGIYRITVRDLFGKLQASPKNTYRLSIRRESPDFRLAAHPEAPPPVAADTRPATVWSSMVRGGETIPLEVIVFRRDGFNGEVNVTAENLPQGVTTPGLRIEAGKNSGLLMLTAAEKAPRSLGTIKIVGRAKLGEVETVREARAGTVLWNVADFNNDPVESRLSRETILAVSGVETAPMSVVPKTERIEAAANSKVEIPLEVIRRAEFGEALKFKATGLALLDKLAELDVDGKATNATLTIDLNQYKLPAGEHTFWLQAKTKGKYRNNPEAAQAATNELKTAETEVANRAADAKKATEAVAAAAKTLTEAEAQLKAATPADKDALTAKAKAAADAKAAAEKAAAEAAAKVKTSEEQKTAAANKAKEATAKAQPKDVTITVYSQPIRIFVKAEEKK